MLVFFKGKFDFIYLDFRRYLGTLKEKCLPTSNSYIRKLNGDDSPYVDRYDYANDIQYIGNKMTFIF